MYQLRTYQVSAKDTLYEKIRIGKRKVVVRSPTGSGKGLMMSDLVNDVHSMKMSTMTVMRRRDLIFQTRDNYNKYHRLNPSIIMGNAKGYDRNNPHQVCSIDTIRTRMALEHYEHLRHCRLYVIDEIQDTNSPTYQRFFRWVLEVNPDAIFVGFSATPFTVGGKPLEFWEDEVISITPEEMMNQGFLVPVIHYAPEHRIDTAGLKLSQGDYKEKDLFDRASESVIVGNIVTTWKKFGENRPSILFAVNKEHSMQMTTYFNMNGIPAIHVDESTSAIERKAAIEGLRSGKYKVMCNIETMTTGVDAPRLSCIILARPTWSEVLYVQMLGRVLRPCKVCADCGFEYGGEKKCIKCGSDIVSFEKTDAIILDHAANAERLGFTYDNRTSQIKALMGLEQLKRFGKGGNKSVPSAVTMCEPCFTYMRPGQPCPRCGIIKTSSEMPKEENGELKLINEALADKLRLNQLLSQYEFLRRRCEQRNGNPQSIWFALYDKVGDVMLRPAIKTGLGVPEWFENKIWQKKQKEFYENEGVKSEGN